MKLWSGRFTKDSSSEMDDFHSSISFDKRLYRQDIMGSIAHAEVLQKCGILTEQEKIKIKDGLLSILDDVEEGKLEFDIRCEDIHMNIEKILTDRIGEEGKKLHTARSRNDQVALDFRIYLKDEIKNIQVKLVQLMNVLIKTAEENLYTVMPGYTHLQPAQPITLAHHLMAYFEMFKRDFGRMEDCYHRTDENPLGSGALAGTTYPIDREISTTLLGFKRFTANSLDSVSDRDFALEFLASSSIIMMHLSRFCEELILWSTREFSFVEMDDGYSTGSSIMPQKKNPDVAELVRGKTGRIYGNLMGLLTVMKGLPMAYNKDMQEDKEGVFDTVDTVKGCLSIFVPMLSTLKINGDKMARTADRGYINATDVADYLANKGIPFRTAHEITGKLVLHCMEQGLSLQDLNLEDYKKFSPVFEQDVLGMINPLNCVISRDIPGGPAPRQVQIHINEAKKFLKKAASPLR